MKEFAAILLLSIAIGVQSGLAARASLGLKTEAFGKDGRPNKDYFQVKLPDAALAEEIEEQQAKENNPALLFKSMMATADAYLFEKKIDKAKEKWKAALNAVQKSVISDVETPKQKRPRRGPPIWIPPNPLQRSIIARALMFLGPAFESAGSLVDAEEVYLASYRLALASDRIAGSIRLNVELLAKKYHSSGDTAYGASILQKFLSLAEEYHGPNSAQVGLWQLKLANYYAASGEPKLTKKSCAEFLASLDGSGMAASRETMEYMIEHTYILRANGFRVEAARVDRKLAKIRKVQDAASSADNHEFSSSSKLRLGT